MNIKSYEMNIITFHFVIQVMGYRHLVQVTFEIAYQIKPSVQIFIFVRSYIKTSLKRGIKITFISSLYLAASIRFQLK